MSKFHKLSRFILERGECNPNGYVDHPIATVSAQHEVSPDEFRQVLDRMARENLIKVEYVVGDYARVKVLVRGKESLVGNPQLSTLRSLLLQSKHNLEFLELEHPQVVRSRELLDAAVAVVDDLIATPPAAIIGAKGGKTTAKRMTKKDPDYYKRIAGMRKKRAGGRPKKTRG